MDDICGMALHKNIILDGKCGMLSCPFKQTIHEIDDPILLFFFLIMFCEKSLVCDQFLFVK